MATVNGTEGNDVIEGSGEGDAVYGFGGDDTLTGGATDTLYGGAGDDTYELEEDGVILAELEGEGTDTVLSHVTLVLGDHLENAELRGSTAIGATGNDLDNVLTGNSAANSLAGGGGDDTLDGAGGADAMAGGSGDDTYIVGSGDTLYEDADGGSDTVRSAIDWVLGDNIEALVLTGGAAVGTGNALDNQLTGTGGDNTLAGLAGGDYLQGRGGRDLLQGGDDGDALDGGSGADTMVGGGGGDSFHVDNAGDVVKETSGDDQDMVMATVSFTLPANVENGEFMGEGVNGTGNGLDNLLMGMIGANRLSGLGGDDTLVGHMGADVLLGGTGNDTFVVYDGEATVVEAAGEGRDTVESGTSWTLGANLEDLLLFDGKSGTGNALANHITGNSGGNQLQGQAGNDTLLGGAGRDRLDGGTGNDLLQGDGAGDADGGDTLLGGDGNDRLFGGGGNDVLAGGRGNDRLDAGEAADADGDVFLFNTTLSAATNKDTVLHYAPEWNQFRLDNGVFRGLAEGALKAGAFVTGTAAKDAGDRIIYDKASGTLYYDADGTGSTAKVAFAVLDNKAVLDAGEFEII